MQQPADAAAAAVAGLGLADDAAGARVHCFAEDAPDATLHFQIIDLGQQLFVWVAVGGAKLQNLFLAIQARQVRAAAVGVCGSSSSSCCWLLTPPPSSSIAIAQQDPHPAVATLLPDTAASGAASMAQRLGEGATGGTTAAACMPSLAPTAAASARHTQPSAPAGPLCARATCRQAPPRCRCGTQRQDLPHAPIACARGDTLQNARAHAGDR